MDFRASGLALALFASSLAGGCAGPGAEPASLAAPGPGLFSEVRVVGGGPVPPTPAPASSRWVPAERNDAVVWAPVTPTPFEVRTASGPVASRAGRVPETPMPAAVPVVAAERPASASGVQRLADPGGDRLADVPAGSAVIFWD